MLLKDFYKILEINKKDNENTTALIELNKHHEIYKGHFPGNPVVPGVCLTQLIKEIMEIIEQHELMLVYADYIKFMAIVNPEINEKLYIDLKIKVKEDNNKQVTSETHYNGTVFYKFKGDFKAK
jgi:3-hydroxyacyl-[acyl-carrier-protein] dehydratase